MPGRNFIFPETMTRPTWQAAHEKKTRSIVPGVPKVGRSFSQLSSWSTVLSLASSSDVLVKTRLATSVVFACAFCAVDSGSKLRGFSYAKPNGSCAGPLARATPLS